MMNLKAKKKWGQNFLVDTTIRERIVEEAGINSETMVIEIGPGQGSITSLMVDQVAHLLAYEIDPDLARVLKGQYQSYKKVEIIEGDFLTRDVKQDINNVSTPFKAIKVVANLPYYITTPIITKLMLELDNIDELVIMVQYEVALRLTAGIKDSDYSALSVITQYYSVPEFLFKVPPQAFRPQPKVDSAVIKLTRLDKRLIPQNLEAQWLEFIRFAFQQPRKTIVNNLTYAYNISKDDIAGTLDGLGLPMTSRADSLSIEILVKIFDILRPKMIQN
jgi:16S rRNA (adenine1518-N6/adenine1519-N6)-dimethyltransferase